MNIMLVEDEPPILRELENYIRKFGEPYQIIATATDGQTARELIDEYQDKIDYLLTDIQIPMMNGLELVEYVKKHYPSVICSILTGYNDFSYVQKALRLKILDYILKPIEEDVLRNQLKEVYEHKCLYYAKEEIITDFTVDTSFSEDLSLNYRQVLINIGQFFYKSDTASIENTASEDFRILEGILRNFQKHFIKYWIMRDRNRHTYFVLFSFNKKQLKSCFPFYNSLYEALYKHFTMVTFIPSDAHITLNSISSHMHNLSKYIGDQILFAQSSFIRMEASENKSFASPALSYTIPIDNILQLCRLFTNGSCDMFRTELHTLINQLKYHPIKQKTLSIYLHTLLTECTVPYLQYVSVQQMELYNIVDDIIQLSNSFDSLYSNLVSIFDDIFATIANETKNVKGKLSTFLQINDYIKKHYTDSINTKMIADNFGFTPAYLSKLFREYKKITPSEYITQLRINKAKELLRSNRSLSIKDVAAAIGYDDPLYFGKVFKKSEGETPKAYQLEEDKS